VSEDRWRSDSCNLPSHSDVGKLIERVHASCAAQSRSLVRLRNGDAGSPNCILAVLEDAETGGCSP
jgi:hypothetical protein